MGPLWWRAPHAGCAPLPRSQLLRRSLRWSRHSRDSAVGVRGNGPWPPRGREPLLPTAAGCVRSAPAAAPPHLLPLPARALRLPPLGGGLDAASPMPGTGPDAAAREFRSAACCPLGGEGRLAGGRRASAPAATPSWMVTASRRSGHPDWHGERRSRGCAQRVECSVHARAPCSARRRTPKPARVQPRACTLAAAVRFPPAHDRSPSLSLADTPSFAGSSNTAQATDSPAPAGTPTVHQIAPRVRLRPRRMLRGTREGAAAGPLRAGPLRPPPPSHLASITVSGIVPDSRLKDRCRGLVVRLAPPRHRRGVRSVSRRGAPSLPRFGARRELPGTRLSWRVDTLSARR
mmetsp:Transcript_4676/g.13738  ORF Transcript_4676/g.13738 Transcript_4676/m.13738 type:complete len:347 (-) Transcript_4676:42-1082(-)